MQCALCSRPIDPKSTWKGAGNQFYCSEFCADSETSESAPAATPATLLELHRKQSYERLERLLPYMRQYLARASAAPRRRATVSQVA
jgi:hypothetical protein